MVEWRNIVAYTEFVHSVTEDISTLDTNGGYATLLLIDLGQFQRLKGTFFEHRADDTLIQSVANRLGKVLPDAKIVARIGDSDYAALLPGRAKSG